MPRPSRAEPLRAGAPVLRPDRHLLYTAAVQHVAVEIDQIRRVARASGRRPMLLREDFCGTAALACAWAQEGPGHAAWGVDLHAPTLAWARRRRLPHIGEAARRVTLIHADARAVGRPRVDVIVALNFSYWVFKTRSSLFDYFDAARRSLRPGGMLFLDAFGGSDAAEALTETSRIPASLGPGGERVPRFTFKWEQLSFNPVDHHLRCAIHFHLADGQVMRRAFHYDWRMWTLPELRELLAEAGFARSRVYLQDWDDAAGEALASYSAAARFENQPGWLAYVVGLA